MPLLITDGLGLGAQASSTGSITVDTFTPPTGSAIDPITGSLSFTVTDTLFPFRVAIVHVQFPSVSANHIEVAHDGVQFSHLYSGSQMSFAPNGYQYVIDRVGGWPAAPTVIPWMVDKSGSINS